MRQNTTKMCNILLKLVSELKMKKKKVSRIITDIIKQLAYYAFLILYPILISLILFTIFHVLTSSSSNFIQSDKI